MKKVYNKKPFRINLFWRILLWFWLAFVLIVTLNLFIIQMNNDSIHYQRMPPHLHHQIILAKNKIIKSIENKRKYKHRRKFWRRIYLIDTAGVDYFGKDVPDLLNTLREHVYRGQHAMSVIEKKELFFGGVPLRIKNKKYRIYIGQKFNYMSRGYIGSFFRKFAQNLLISTFIISFPLSFLLAWLFTRPIKKLQQATKDISQDVTNRKNLQALLTRRDEFGELAQDFELMSQHIESQLLSKTQLLSDVSHELRSPLARLQIALAIAENKLATGSNNHEFARIKIEDDRMNLMLAGLLDYAKIEALSHASQFEIIDINNLLSLLINDANFEAQQQKITITTELEHKLRVDGDKAALLSCLENILRNAIRYAEKKITVCSYIKKNNNQLMITISDDGNGIKSDDIDKIFEAFYRPNLDRSRDSGGVGLGLSIAKKAVKAHSGKIWAENIQPHGFSIHIQLPIKHDKSLQRS
ncbi:MAG: HAMP domain-containing protein [Colwellia sp.]|nr:HAMP domain-containing protein [Colwellia sp.]